MKRVCGIPYPLKLCRKLSLVWPLGGFFLALQISLIEFGLSLLVLNFCLAYSVVRTLSQLSLTLCSLEILRKNKRLNIRMIDEAKKIWVQNPSGGFFTFCKINIYVSECFRCVCHEILSRLSLTLIQAGWYFTGLIIMVHYPCTL